MSTYLKETDITMKKNSMKRKMTSWRWKWNRTEKITSTPMPELNICDLKNPS